MFVFKPFFSTSFSKQNRGLNALMCQTYLICQEDL